MASARAWVQAARPLAAGNVLIPVAWGAVFAVRGLPLDVAGLAFALLWAWLDQLFIVFANDLADEGADRLGNATLMSGGSRVLVQGKLTRRALARAATLAATLLVALSVGLAAWLGTWVLPGLALAALVLLWAYSFGPLRRSYHGGGMSLQAIGVGVVLPCVGWVLQGRALGELNPLVFLPPLALAGASHLFTALPDVEGDRRGDKLTRPVRKGERRVRAEAFAAMAVAAGLAAPCLGVPWLWGLAGVLGVSLAFAVARNFVCDAVGRVRFSLVGLVVNVALWASWIAAALAIEAPL